CGKTTLLQHVLLTFANNRQGKRRQHARVPFFLEMRKVAEQLDKKTQPDLPKLLEAYFKKDRFTADIAKQLPKGWVERALRSGKCVLLWDGLDEIADLTARRKAAAWLDAVVANPDYRTNCFVVSARPAGYQGAPLERAQVLEVQPFAFDDILRFINQWYHA